MVVHLPVDAPKNEGGLVGDAPGQAVLGQGGWVGGWRREELLTSMEYVGKGVGGWVGLPT